MMAPIARARHPPRALYEYGNDAFAWISRVNVTHAGRQFSKWAAARAFRNARQLPLRLIDQSKIGNRSSHSPIEAWDGSRLDVPKYNAQAHDSPPDKSPCDAFGHHEESKKSGLMAMPITINLMSF